MRAYLPRSRNLPPTPPSVASAVRAAATALNQGQPLGTRSGRELRSSLRTFRQVSRAPLSEMVLKARSDPIQPLGTSAFRSSPSWRPDAPGSRA